MTLLQHITGFIDNISVTDRQEESIKGSLSNLDGHLMTKDNGLNAIKTFTNGSYERDTILRPLDDIDMFCILKREKWLDTNGVLSNPQTVLTKIKNYLDDQPDYKDKVSQNRPCVTVRLSDKNFDILPAFEAFGGGYMMPNDDLTDWTYTYPEQLSSNLDSVHRNRNYKVKPTVKAIKQWNRECGKIIPSYHIEEVAINIFNLSSFTNFEESIRLWFSNARYNLLSQKFRSNDAYNTMISKINKVAEKLGEAKQKYDEGMEDEAIIIWKNIFGKEFPIADIEEAKSFSKALTAGTLKISASGVLSQVSGNPVSALKGGFYGNEKDFK